MANELSKDNISEILESYYPERFQNLSPIDFERLIKFLLEKKYSRAEITNASGDFGADVIAYTSSQEKIICQVKRYKKGNKVGNKYINDCIGAIEYYNGDKGLVITTSSYTKSAKEIAGKADIELWGWNDLTEEISKYFFEGKDYYNYFEKESEISNDLLKVELDRIEQAGATKGNNTYNWFYINLENLTKKIVEVSIVDVTILNSNNRQFSFDDWHKGYFSSGEIYPRAKVEASFNVSRQKAGLLKSGTKVYLKALVNDEEKLFTLNHEKNKLNSKQNDKKGYSTKDDKQEETKYLIRQEESNKILLKSPVAGKVSGYFYFNKDSFLVKPNTVICRVDGIKLKAGSEGYINKICVEDSTLVESGDTILVLNKNKEKHDQSEPDSPDNNEPNFIIVFWFMLVIIILVALILASQS